LIIIPKGLASQWAPEMRVHFNENFNPILPEELRMFRRFSVGFGTDKNREFDHGIHGRGIHNLLIMIELDVFDFSVYSVYSVVDRFFHGCTGLSGQIQRAVFSLMSNIAEGFERGNPREFQQLLSIEKSSCAEVRSKLYVALDAGYLEEAAFKEPTLLAKESGRIIGGLRVSVAHLCVVF
jgi:four helix bundle protein